MEGYRRSKIVYRELALALFFFAKYEESVKPVKF